MKIYNIAMKVFKYKFSRLIKGLIIAGLALCAIGFAYNIFQIFYYGTRDSSNPYYYYIQYALTFIMVILLAAILISVLINSHYAVNSKTFKTCFGFIKSSYNIEDIQYLSLNKNTNKLSVHFKSGEYIVIVVKQDWYEDFINAILEANPSIQYIIESKDEKPEDKKDD